MNIERSLQLYRKLLLDPFDWKTLVCLPHAHPLLLTYKADNEVPRDWRDPNLANHARPIMTTCETGDIAALADKSLKGRSFTRVRILKDAMLAWKDAGYPTHVP